MFGARVGHTIDGGTNGFGAGFEANRLGETTLGFGFFFNDSGGWGSGGSRDDGDTSVPEGLDGNKRSGLGKLGEDALNFLFGDQFLAGKGDGANDDKGGDKERQKFERGSLHGG